MGNTREDGPFKAIEELLGALNNALGAVKRYQDEVVHLQQTLEAHRKIERALKLWRKWYLDQDQGVFASEFNMALAGKGPRGEAA